MDDWRVLAQRLLGPPEFTAVEVAEQTGVDLAHARRLWQALGFPPVADDARIFTRMDVAMLQAARALAEQGVTDPQTLLQMARVEGQALARIAEAQVAAAAETLGAPGASGSDALMRAELVDVLEPFLGYVWRRHLLAATWRYAVGNSASEDTQLSIGFADIVGFTPLSQQLTDRELADLVDRFEALVYAHVPERGGRVVKMIGDEVMFAADEVAVGAEIALSLASARRADVTLPALRVGLATGPVLSLEGDLFGPTVNLAHRLVGFARPETVLVSDRAAAALRATAAYHLRPLHRFPVKGIGRVRAYALRRPAGGQPR
jgi:adenylate cyclase